MKIIRLIFVILSVILFQSFFFQNKTLADWAYPFVVWGGYIYVAGNVEVASDNVNEEIGQVTLYSDIEGTYRGNFSNQYKKGTKYFSIKGVSTNKAIAVKQEDGTFVKAERNGEYAGGKYSLTTPILGFLGLIAFVSVIVYMIEKSIKNERIA